LFQGSQQIAGPIGGKRCGQIFLLIRRQCQFVRINHRRIIKAPLQKIIGDEAGGAHGRAARLHGGLIAVGQQQRGLRVAEFHLAVHHRKRGAVGGVHRHDKFRAFHPGHGTARDDADAARLVAVKK